MWFQTYWLTRLSLNEWFTSMRHPRAFAAGEVLQPMRLEERRLLDAAPVITSLDLDADDINEGDTVTLTGEFQDAPPTDQGHRVIIDWGDGTTSEVDAMPRPGSNSGAARFFTATHTYLDDDPSVTTQDDYTITVTVIDSDMNSDVEQTEITVRNVAPEILSFDVSPDEVDPGQTVTTSFTFAEVGVEDVNFAYIDWGDGDVTFTFLLTQNSFSATHVYDEAGLYTISLELYDDDQGLDTREATVSVGNLAPEFGDVTIDSPVDENELTTLSGEIIIGAGSGNDTHRVLIDWGDGSGVTELNLAAGVSEFTAQHRYLDDNPTGTSSDLYNVHVTVIDNFGGRDDTDLQVRVDNVAPVIDTLAVNPTTPDEGEPFQLQGTFSDPGSRDTFTALINWGDGNSESALISGRNLSGSHAYIEPGIYTITVTLTDDDGGMATEQLIVNVGNVPPQLGNVTVDSPISENQLTTLTGQIALGPGSSDDTHQVRIDWGDGSGVTVLNLAAGVSQFTAQHRYLDDNPTGTPSDIYNVRVTVIDDDGGQTNRDLSVQVNNVAPVIDSLTANPTSPDEGQSVQLQGSFSDPGTEDTFTALINWGDGSSEAAVINGKNLSGSHVYADPGAYTVTVTLTDDDSGQTSEQLVINVGNVPPQLGNVTIDSPISENDVTTLSGEIVLGPGSSDDTHRVLIDWGDGSGVTELNLAAGVSDFTAQHRYLDDDPTGTPSDIYNVRVNVIDDDGGQSGTDLQVRVNNVAPVIDTLAANPTSPQEGDAVQLQGSFSDPGTQDTFTALINWGDGSSEAAVINGNNLSGSHVYADPGVYTVTVTLTDDDGGQTTQRLVINVGNVPPQLGDVNIDSPISENDVTTLSGEILLGSGSSDDAHQVRIDWGDGSGVTVLNLAAGVSQFTAQHRYLDDNPTGTPSDIYNVRVTVIDDDGGQTGADLQVQVNNVAPVIDSLSTTPSSPNENEAFQLQGRFTDPGTRDTFTAVINWGDGNSETAQISGNRLTGTHTYAEPGVYTITVTLTDDDGGETTEQLVVTVRNVPPQLGDITIDSPILENETATLTGEIASAATGNAGAHRVLIDWGDGSAVTQLNLAAGVSRFSTQHQYLDDAPSGTSSDLYNVRVTVIDDFGDQTSARVPVQVLNDAPMITSVNSTVSETVEGGVAVSGQFSDQGALDSHTVTINWGDGSAPTVLQLPQGSREFFAERVFNTDGFYQITVTVSDDDISSDVTSAFAEFAFDDELVVTDFLEPAQPPPADTPPANAVIAANTRDSRASQIAIFEANPTTSIPFESNTSGEAIKQTEDRGAEDEVVVIEVLSPEGKTIRKQDLPPTVLSDLPGYIRKLPDGHYRFYLKNAYTQRLVMDVHVRGGQIIDPKDLLKVQEQADAGQPSSSPPTAQLRIDPPAHAAATTDIPQSRFAEVATSAVDSADVDWAASVDAAMSLLSRNSFRDSPPTPKYETAVESTDR